MEAARRRTPIRAEESATTCEERSGGRGLTCSADADGISLFESMPLRVGDSVLIHSLRSSRRYNGVAAEVVASGDRDGDRVGVRLLHGTDGHRITMVTAELSLRGCRDRNEPRLDAVVSTAKPLPAFGARKSRCVSPSHARSTSSVLMKIAASGCWRCRATKALSRHDSFVCVSGPCACIIQGMPQPFLQPPFFTAP